MSFNDNVNLDTSQVSSGGGRGPGLKIGGGLGGLVIVVIGLYFGVDLSGVTGGTDPGVGAVPESPSTLREKCRTGADANRDVECRVVGTVNSVQAYWGEELPRYGRDYPPAKTTVYTGQTESACGTASNAVGPFYCPTDKKIYIDASFFDQLTTRFGADDGALAPLALDHHEQVGLERQ